MSPVLSLTQLRSPGASTDLLILGPSLGTAVVPLWSACAESLPDGFSVVGWDLPGHGASAPADEPFTVADLAASVLEATRALREQAARVLYAGVSLGGAVGLQLAVAHGVDVAAVAVLCSGARIGEAQGWRERAELVRRAGTPVMVESSAGRWFAPGFIERHPERATALLHSLQEADRFSYARCCEALADFDLRDRLKSVRVPVLAVAGEHDPVAPPSLAEAIAAGTGGRAEVLRHAAHLVPAEQPEAVARLLSDFFGERRP